MKKLLIILFVLSCFGCEYPNEEPEEKIMSVDVNIKPTGPYYHFPEDEE